MKRPFIRHATCLLAAIALLHSSPHGRAQAVPEAAPAVPEVAPAVPEVAVPVPEAAPVVPPETTAVTPTPTVEDEPPVPAGKIRLNFRNAPMDAVLDHLSRAAGFVIIKDVPVAGTVDVWSHQPMSPDEAVELVNTVLARLDLAAVRSDRVLRIVSRETALKADLPVASGADPEVMQRSEAMATQIIPVKHADAAKLVENLKPLLGTKSELSANTSSNSLILTDTRTNIRRMTLIVQALDTSISNISEIQVFQLKHAKAESLATVIGKVFEQPTQNRSSSRDRRTDFFARMRGGRGGPGGGGSSSSTASGTSEAKTATTTVTATADERSNSVVVRASEELMPQIAKLVEAVDVPTEDDAVVDVFPLKYADADDVVEVLEKIYPSDTTSNANTSGQRRFSMFGRSSRQPQTTSGSSLGEAEVSVVADSRTNSVVVSASPITLTAVGKVIEKLDETPKNVTQVYIYRIENADLENLKEILEGMFDDIEDTGTTTNLAPGGGSARTGGATGRRN